MALAGDLLSAQNPLRLACRRGGWVLEVTRLIAVDRNVFQPRVQRFEGADAVLSQLRRNPESQSLVTAASQLMRSTRPDDDRSFEAVDGEWVLNHQASYSLPAPGPDGRPVGVEFGEVRAELTVLRASHERLKERVLRLEKILAGGTAHGASSAGRTGVDPPLRGGPAATQLDPNTDVLEPGPKGSAAQSESGHRVEPFMPPPIAESDVGSPAETEVASPEPPPEAHPPASKGKQRGAGASARANAKSLRAPPPSERSGPPLEPPGVQDVLSCLKSLIGDQLGMTEQKRPTVERDGELLDWYACRLIDDEGIEVGALICDLSAIVMLGGTLMMLPAPELQRQISEHAPSEDVMAAMSEIGNTLSGPLNQRTGNPHVRARPLEAFSQTALPWVKSARRVLELELSPSGKILILGR